MNLDELKQMPTEKIAAEKKKEMPVLFLVILFVLTTVVVYYVVYALTAKHYDDDIFSQFISRNFSTGNAAAIAFICASAATFFYAYYVGKGIKAYNQVIDSAKSMLASEKHQQKVQFSHDNYSFQKDRYITQYGHAEKEIVDSENFNFVLAFSGARMLVINGIEVGFADIIGCAVKNGIVNINIKSISNPIVRVDFQAETDKADEVAALVNAIIEMNK